MATETTRTIAIVTSVFFALLIAVTAAAWTFQDPANRSVDAVHVAVALAPFVFYLFVSDKLKQFKGGHRADASR